jgi:hypothetical protein
MNSGMKSFTDLKNCWVEFKIGDVFIPDPETILVELHSADILQGKVLDLSPSGVNEETCAIIEVEGLKERVIVPVDRILSVHGSSNR